MAKLGRCSGYDERREVDVIRHWEKAKRLLRNEKGVTLVETLIAVALVGIAASAVLTGYSTGPLSIRKADRLVTARTLAVSQLEYTLSQAYVVAPTSYDPLTPLSAGYSISSDATSISGRDENVQRITVTVQYGGKVLLTLEAFKVDQ